MMRIGSGTSFQEKCAMDANTRSLFADFLDHELACDADVAATDDREKIVRRLRALEDQSWSESPFEVENTPQLYRKLLSALDDLDLLEQRYNESGHDYLKQSIAKRYSEVLAAITDAEVLRQRCTTANPGLRYLVIARFEQLLPEEIEDIAPDAVPGWFVRLFRQPSEILNFLSEPTCAKLADKTRKLLDTEVSRYSS
jgi:hypothetical protein